MTQGTKGAGWRAVAQEGQMAGPIACAGAEAHSTLWRTCLLGLVAGAGASPAKGAVAACIAKAAEGHAPLPLLFPPGLHKLRITPLF